MVDPWSREPVAQEFPYQATNGLVRLVDVIKDQGDRMRELTSNLLTTAGIRLTQAGMTILKALVVDGSLDVNGPLVVAGTAAFSGDTTIGGSASITGTLSLPAGIIGNDALASPVGVGSIYFATSGFALTTGAGTFASQTITVPAGFTSAVVSVVGRLFAVNPNAGYGYLSAVSKISGIGGSSIPLLVQPSGGSGINVSPYSRVLTGLTGGSTFQLAVMGNTNIANWAADIANRAEMSGTILWLR